VSSSEKTNTFKIKHKLSSEKTANSKNSASPVYRRSNAQTSASIELKAGSLQIKDMSYGPWQLGLIHRLDFLLHLAQSRKSYSHEVQAQITIRDEILRGVESKEII
jgi:hypothetical protein